MTPPPYSNEPDDPQAFTRRFDRFYSRTAPFYGLLVTAVPIWGKWLRQALPHLQGPRVLEVSFGTGHLMAQYAGRWQTAGIDLNGAMAAQAAARLRRAGLSAWLQIAAVEQLPYAAGAFDSVLNTMAFSGYPNARRALGEMGRVLRPGGRLVMIDVNFPRDGNRAGRLLARFWQAAGDLLRDVPALFREMGWPCQDREIGAFGSVHLYLADKPG